MKILNEITIKNTKTGKMNHFFEIEDYGKLNIIYDPLDPEKERLIESYRILIREAVNILDYHDRLFDQRFKERIIKDA